MRYPLSALKMPASPTQGNLNYHSLNFQAFEGFCIEKNDVLTFLIIFTFRKAWCTISFRRRNLTALESRIISSCCCSWYHLHFLWWQQSTPLPSKHICRYKSRISGFLRYSKPPSSLILVAFRILRYFHHNSLSFKQCCRNRHTKVITVFSVPQGQSFNGARTIQVFFHYSWHPLSRLPAISNIRYLEPFSISHGGKPAFFSNFAKFSAELDKETGW